MPASHDRIFLRDVQGGTWDGTGILKQQLIQQQLETEPRPFENVFYNFANKVNMERPALVVKLKDWDGMAMHCPEAGESNLIDWSTKKVNVEVYKIREGFGISHEMDMDSQYDMYAESTQVVRDRILRRMDWDLAKLAVFGAYGTTFKNTNMFVPLAASTVTFDEYTHYIQPYAADVTATTGQTYISFQDILRMQLLLMRAGRNLTDVFMSVEDAFSLKSQITPVVSATVPYGLQNPQIASGFVTVDGTGWIGSIYGIKIHISNHCQYANVSNDVSTTDGHIIDQSRVGKDAEWLMEGNEAVWNATDTTAGAVCAKHHRVAIGVDGGATTKWQLGVYEDITAEPEFRNTNQTVENYMYTRVVPYLKYGRASVVLYGLNDIKET
jgi:hypothetical protein